jgi:hypothetical protein
MNFLVSVIITKFEVHMVLCLRIQVFWDMTLCSQVSGS